MKLYDIALKMLLSFKRLISKPRKMQNEHTQPVSHEIFDVLLKKYVSEDGWVNYQGFDSERVYFKSYLDILSKNPPNETHWSESERLVYWMNAYNAFTIELILQHYPVKTIRDIGGKFPMINSSWDLKFFKLGGADFDLNTIEHEILRKDFDESRIHFAIVCASVSCPRLLNEAYVASRVEAQLELQAKDFVNRTSKNNITKEKAELSQIFDWYQVDFTKSQTLVEYINQYSDVKIEKDTKISYLEYDWGLNEWRF